MTGLIPDDGVMMSVRRGENKNIHSFPHTFAVFTQHLAGFLGLSLLLYAS